MRGVFYQAVTRGLVAKTDAEYKRTVIRLLVGGRIARLEDAHVDHITAYVKGGLTDLANAQLLHKKHNMAKGAR